ncbi:poly(R)-hydroxyalkanoic acid synthase subunit PhaE [Desulfococcus sp.]|uniref:poly(R)-hydroxyalkanoic acid synthase subunit PhaE n=1 Tax=Desulfococcus sp. TaxID=2025834 RepID=UPI003593EECD
MKKDNKGTTGSESIMGDWMSQVVGFWENMAKTGTESPGPFGIPGMAGQEKARKNLEAGGKMFQTMVAFLSKPETIEGMMKGLDETPDLLSRLARQSWEGFFDLQKQWMERAARMGRETKAYSFEDIDQDTFRSVRELYEKEFQKFLQVPQLGLTRFYQERFNRLIDNQNLFQAALSEFIYMFYVPIEKTTGVMQEKMEEMAEAGEIHDDFKVYYNMWIKILEGHYMTLLKSPEYAEVMDNTIHALVDYRRAKEDFLCDLLQNLPIPTHRDMDALYKEFHLMKKKIRELSRKVESRPSEESE